MSNDDKMREAFDNFWLRNNPGLDSSFKGVAWAVFKTCAAIKDAEIAKMRAENILQRDALAAADSHISEQEKEIASRDLMIKELREALLEFNVACDSSICSGAELSAYHKSKRVLEKTKHHNSRALEKMLLWAELNGLNARPIEGMKRIAVIHAKLAELNKE